MLKLPPIDRRTVVIGGLTLPLLGCNQNQSPDESYREAPVGSAANTLTQVREVISTVSMIAQAAEIIGTIFGPARLLALAGRISRIAGFAELVANVLGEFGIAGLQSPHRQIARAWSPLDLIIPPAYAQNSSAPSFGEPGRPPQNLGFVTFAGGQASVLVDCRNRSATEFLTYNVYTVVRAAGQPRPTTIDDAMRGPGALPTFSFSLPANQVYRNPLPFQPAPGEGYVVYTWFIPTSAELTNDAVAQGGVIGPIFYNADPYDTELAEAVRQEASGSASASVDYNIYRS